MSLRSTMRRTAVLAAATLTVAALVTVATSGAPASATPLSCFGVSQILAESQNGALTNYEHDAPESGDPNAWFNPMSAGSGWFGRVLFGAGGDVYNITPSGDLRWYEYGGGDYWYTQGGTSPNGLTIGTGWGDYLSSPDRGLITTGLNDAIYVVRGDDLVEYQYNGAANSWANPQGTVVASGGWQNYTTIVASFDTFSPSIGLTDVIYAIDHAGNLFRYTESPATNAWSQTPQLVGSGWGQYAQLLSPGKDILYAVNGNTGVMNWFHFNGDTRTWDNNGAGRVVGTGWYSSAFADVSMEQSTCDNAAPFNGYQPNQYVNCQANSRVFDARPDGSLWLYEDTAPDNTTTVTWTNVRQIGSGFTGRVIASDASYVYDITPSGDLNLYHYGQNSWANPGETIGTGWDAWASGAGQGQITVDSTGTIYVVNAQGQLVSYRYDEDHGGWQNSGTVIDSGWGGYRLILAGDDGEFYAVDGQGNLYRSHYNAAAGQWITHSQMFGSGWQNITSMASAGANTVYAVNGQTGQLDWYDFGSANADAASANAIIGSDWYAPAHPQVSTATDTCVEPLPALPPALKS